MNRRKQSKRKPADVKRLEQFEKWHEKTFGRPVRPAEPSWQWPPNYPPRFPQKATERVKWVIGEAERTLKEACERLSKSDDRQLEYLLIDFASLIYCAFLDEAEEQLRSGEWSVGKHDSLDFSVIAGLFIRDIGEGACQKFRALAACPENKTEMKAYVFGHSEVVYAVVNSIRVRQKGTDLNAAVRKYLFRPDAETIRNEGLQKIAADKGNPALLEGKETVAFRTAEQYLGITDRQRQNLIRSGSLAIEGQGQNRRITTDSLKKYLPPRKPETTRSDAK